MAEKYYSILTNRGKALEAQSSATGKPVIIKDFVVGDGNGQAVLPDPTLTSLKREVYRAAISALQVSPEQPHQFIAQLVLPAGVGGFVVREVGLLTDAGELYAVANCAAIEKPASGISVRLQFRLAVSETADIELKVATGDGLFLRQNANLGDVEDAAESRKNIGLKSAATADVQVNRDDTTPGRVLVNGGALAIRSVAAKAGTDIADASALPANSVSFCYADAAYSPGYEATILDVGGLSQNYRVQYAASYADGGKRLKFRTLNGDNGYWGSWTNVLTNYGGSVAYLDGAGYYQINPVGPVGWYGSGMFAGQYANSAPFIIPQQYKSPKDVSVYLPIIKGLSSTDYYGYGSAVSFGILRTGNADFGSAIIQIIGDNGDGAVFGFNANGSFNAPNAIVAGGGLYDTPNVRVYSSNNPPPRQDLSPYATYTWTRQYFVGDVAMGAEGSFVVYGNSWQRVPAGCAMTGYNFEGQNPGGDTYFYRPIQKYMHNIGWITIGHTA